MTTLPISNELKLYIEYVNLTPMQRLALIQEAKANNPKAIKSVAKLDRACFELFKSKK